MSDQRAVYVALLCHSGLMQVATTLSIVESMVSVAKSGIKFSWDTMTGDSLVARARNTIARKFMELGHDDLIMVDDDVSWEPGAMLRLLKPEVDVVVGPYRMRCDPERYPVRLDTTGKDLIADPATGLLEVECAPTGFMRISRKCLLAMIEQHKDRFYADDILGGQTCDLFGHGLHDGRYWGEDFAFCRRWRAMGGKVWIDPEVKMQHTGFKTFEGKMGDWFRSRPGYQEQAEARFGKPAATNVFRFEKVA